MAGPAIFDIIGDRRVEHEEIFTFFDVDWSASTYKMQVRAVKDTTGSPLLDLSTGTGSFATLFAGTDTVANHVAANRLTQEQADELRLAGTDSLTLTQIFFGINAFGMSSFPFPEATMPGGERGDDWQGWYDIIRTPPADPDHAELVAAGKFIVRAGVTIP